MYETTGPEQKRPLNFQEEADAKMLFHVGHLVARNNVAVRTTDTDIIALANIEKLPAGTNVWLQMGLHTNITLRYVNAPSTR